MSSVVCRDGRRLRRAGSDPTINFRPFANATIGNVPENSSGPGAAQRPERLSRHHHTEHAHVRAARVSRVTERSATSMRRRARSPTPRTRDSSGRIVCTYQVTATGPQTHRPRPRSATPGSCRSGGASQHRRRSRSSARRWSSSPRPSFTARTSIHIAQIASCRRPTAERSSRSISTASSTRPSPAINDHQPDHRFRRPDREEPDRRRPQRELATTIDSGHGTVAFLTGGGGPTREHGWFGHTTLIGGPGPNQLIGLAGKVKFKPSKATDLIFAGKPRRRTALLNPLPPGGTYYKFVHGHLVPISTSEVKAGQHPGERRRRSTRRADGQSQPRPACCRARFDERRPRASDEIPSGLHRERARRSPRRFAAAICRCQAPDEQPMDQLPIDSSLPEIDRATRGAIAGAGRTPRFWKNDAGAAGDPASRACSRPSIHR